MPKVVATFPPDSTLVAMQDEEYLRLAEVEDGHWYFRALHALVGEALSGALGGRPAAVLDAGCGTGGLIRRLASRNPAWVWTGVDASPAAVELARARTNAAIVEGRLERLPFPDRSFDAAVCADVLYHLADDAAAVRELRRVLRPGGLVVVNVPAHPWLWSYHDVAVAGVRRYRRTGLAELLRGGGFGAARISHWNTLLLPLIALRRKVLPPPRQGSDVRPAGLAGHALGTLATAAERSWLRRWRLPFGSSLFATAD